MHKVQIPFLAALLLCSIQAFGKDEDLSNVNSVLDRLEKRLLDQEADGLTFDERSSKDATPAKRPRKDSGFDINTELKFEKGEKIEGDTPNRQELSVISDAIKSIENQADQLASSIQKTKQTIIDDASINNFIAIEAALAETDAAAIKSLNIKLDGYAVYELQEASGLWLPSKSIPLFSGPMQPGTHKIELEARLVIRENAGLPLNSDVLKIVSKTFDIAVPVGTKKSRYVISITPPGKDSDKADATMKEAT